MEDKVLTGAIAIIKSGGKVVGKMKTWRCTEDITRGDVQGIGTIYTSEVPVLKYKGNLSCSAMSVSYKDGIIPNALKRGIGTVASQALSSRNASFEDNLVLEDDGLTIECYKKVKDVIDNNGNIKPKVVPFVIVNKWFITSSGLDVSEAAISGTDQSGVFLDPIIYP